MLEARILKFKASVLGRFSNLNSIHKYKLTQRVHRPRLAVAFPIKTPDWIVMVGVSDVLSTLLQRNVMYIVQCTLLKCGFLSDI